MLVAWRSVLLWRIVGVHVTRPLRPSSHVPANCIPSTVSLQLYPCTVISRPVVAMNTDFQLGAEKELLGYGNQ
jgi:hypothetical protein